MESLWINITSLRWSSQRCPTWWWFCCQNCRPVRPGTWRGSPWRSSWRHRHRRRVPSSSWLHPSQVDRRPSSTPHVAWMAKGCECPPKMKFILNSIFLLLGEKVCFLVAGKPTIFLVLVKKSLCRSISSRNFIADLNLSKMRLEAPLSSLLNLSSCSLSILFSMASCSRCSVKICSLFTSTLVCSTRGGSP